MIISMYHTVNKKSSPIRIYMAKVIKLFSCSTKLMAKRCALSTQYPASGSLAQDHCG